MNKSIKILLAAFVIITLTGTTVHAIKNLSLVNSYNSIAEYSKIEKNKVGLEKYKTEVMKRNNKLKIARLDGIIATITFNEPISAQKLEFYVKKHSIHPVQIQARSIQANGARVTTMTKTTKGFKETDEIVKQQAMDSDATFVGYVSMYALVDSNKIEGIENDHYTYLIDTSADFFHSGESQVNGVTRNQLSYENINKLGKRFPHSLAWDLEDIRKVDKARDY